MTATPRVLVVDATALAFRAFFAIRGLTDDQGRPSGALYGFISSLLRVVEAEQAELVVVAWDRSEPTFRHKLCEEYKANRDELDDDLRVQFPWMREVVELLGLCQLDRAGFEADDILASLAVQGAEQGYEVRLCASDKDLAQVVSNQVKLCPPPKRNDPIAELGPAEVEEKFGVLPELMAEWQALVGDSSDNVKGVPGVGPKRATILLQKYGSLENILRQGPLQEKGKLRENLELSRQQAQLALELVTLKTDMDLGDISSFTPQERKQKQLLDFCGDHSFNSLRDRFAAADTNFTAGDDAPPKPAEQSFPAPKDRDYRLVNTPDLLDQLLNGLQKSGGFAIDTETTGLDPLRCKLVGISFCWDDNCAWYLPVNLDPPLLSSSQQDPLALLAPILLDQAIPKIGQNIKYDAHVLKQANLEVRGWSFDTMIAHCLADPINSHGLDSLAMHYLDMKKIATSEIIGKGKQQTTMDLVPIEDVSRYACEDAHATWLLVNPLKEELAKAKVEQLFEDVEMPLITVLQEMEANGICIDKARLKEMEKFISRRQLELEERIFEIAGSPFNINSPKQLSPILFEKLKIQDIVGVKRLRKTKTGYSTNAAVLEKFRGVEIVDLISEFRHLAKLRSTYVEALPGFVNPNTNCIHTSYHQSGTSTGRMSSSDPNLQNIPIRTELGREIRRAFVPRNNSWVMVSADYSQIELRVVAHLAGDPQLQQAFRDGADVHARTAALIFGVEVEEVSSEMRSRAKTINFGILYGMGPQRLARELKITFAEAREFIEAYFEALPGVRHWLDQTLADAEKKGEVRTLFGRRRPMPELESSDGRVRASAENVAVNTPVQGAAADLIKMAMLKVSAALQAKNMQAKMMLQVHDELVFDCPTEELEQLCDLVRREMEDVAKLDVPLMVEIGSGADWASAH